MIRRHIDLFLFATLFMLLFDGQYLLLKGEDKPLRGIRESIIAGQWYPGNRNALSNMINTYLNRVTVDPKNEDIVAGIVPHAGYIYSGQVAAYAYGFLKGKDFNRVIIIGPSHRVGFNGVSVNLQSGYQTPLGITPVDREFGQRLVQSSNLISYIPKVHENEHSVEIQVPFLQTVLNDFSIVPIVMGSTDNKIIDTLAKALIGAIADNEKTLILASSDLSHYHNDDLARKLDKEFIRNVEKFNPQGLSEALSSELCEACGRAPVIATMMVAKALKADTASILCYANSGDITGDKRRVVGYLSALFLKTN